MFQHTAARRRLLSNAFKLDLAKLVSTHSRAEAAAYPSIVFIDSLSVSTHSRAEAAAYGVCVKMRAFSVVSTHSRAEAAAQDKLKSL